MNVQDKWDCWVEFKAVFTESKLQKIELFKFDKTDNAERKQRNIEWEKQLEREDNLWYNKYFFRTKPYFWFYRKIFIKFLDLIINFLKKIRGY